MPRLKWFLVGIAVTAFVADYVRLKAERRLMEETLTKAELAILKSQTTATSCLVDLAYVKARSESDYEKKKFITMAQVAALDTIDRAREGDAEAMMAIQDVGYSIGPGKKLTPIRYGMGGPLTPSH